MVHVPDVQERANVRSRGARAIAFLTCSSAEERKGPTPACGQGTMFALRDSREIDGLTDLVRLGVQQRTLAI